MSTDDKPVNCDKLSINAGNSTEAQECLSRQVQDSMRTNTGANGLKGETAGNGGTGLRADNIAPIQAVDEATRERLFQAPFNNAVGDFAPDATRLPLTATQVPPAYLDSYLGPDKFRLNPNRNVLAPETVDGFRLKPYPEIQPKLNLSLQGYDDYSYRGREFGPLPARPYEDLRQRLDRAITFDLRAGDTPFQMTLNPRKCGLRSNTGICFRIQTY